MSETLIEFGEVVTPAKRRVRAVLCLGPGLLWLCVWLLIPLVLIAAISFLTRGDYGEFQKPFTIESYRRLAGYGDFGFDSLYPTVLLRSLVLGLATAILCVVTATPLAFFIALLRPRWRVVALTLVVIPFWTNLLIRTYAWQMLLADDGPLRWIVGQVYPGPIAVLIGMACDYLPFMVLPIYASVEKMDWTLVEAASDLGAHGTSLFWHAILPQIRPGLIAGFMLVFLPAVGQFVIPDLLGGAKTMLLGNAIQQQFGSSRDWPFGSAISTVSLFLMLGGMWIFNKFSKTDKGIGV